MTKEIQTRQIFVIAANGKDYILTIASKTTNTSTLNIRVLRTTLVLLECYKINRSLNFFF